MTGRERLLRCYPAAWRERYGDDLAAYLDDAYAGRLPLRAAASLVAGGCRERVRFARVARSALPASERVRSGVLTVLAGWAAFVVAGSGFAKISEHFDSSLAPDAHRVPDVAYTVVQDVAVVSGLIVALGLGLAVPALLRFLSHGGWPVVRHHGSRAMVATGLTAGATVAVAEWAHRLSAAQRNGGDAGYAAFFLVWAALIAVTVGLWTVAAIATARSLTLPRLVLMAEGALAATVTTGMLVMLAATAVWWTAVAPSAPSFFGNAAGSPARWTPQLVGTVVLMVAAATAGGAGVIRIVRAARAM